MASLTEEIADALARDAIRVAQELGDESLITEISRVIGASSTTTQEAFMTAVRVRLSEGRARQALAEKLGKTSWDEVLASRAPVEEPPVDPDTGVGSALAREIRLAERAPLRTQAAPPPTPVRKGPDAGTGAGPRRADPSPAKPATAMPPAPAFASSGRPSGPTPGPAETANAAPRSGFQEPRAEFRPAGPPAAQAPSPSGPGRAALTPVVTPHAPAGRSASAMSRPRVEPSYIARDLAESPGAPAEAPPANAPAAAAPAAALPPVQAARVEAVAEPAGDPTLAVAPAPVAAPDPPEPPAPVPAAPAPTPGSLAEALARAASLPRSSPAPDAKKPVQNPYSDIEMPDGDWG